MNNFKFTVGLYDSGIGGLTVLNEAVKSVKGCNFIYLGDNANAPYGNKSISALKNLAIKNVNELLKYQVNAIILACNTLSTSLYGYLLNHLNCLNKKIYDVKLIGVFPPPPLYGKNSALICTPITARSDYVKEIFKNSKVVPLPFLAYEIEKFIFDKSKISYVADTSSLAGVKEIILGCTHYLYIKKEIKTLFPSAIISSGADESVKKLINFYKTAVKNGDLNCFNRVNNIAGLRSTVPITVNENSVYFIGDFAYYNKRVFSTRFL